MRLRAPIVVRPSTTACGADPRSPAPIRTCGPITAYGPTAHAVGRARRRGDTTAVGWTRGPVGRRDGELDLGDDGVADVDHAAEPPRAARPRRRGHLEAERVAGDDRAAEACPVDAAERRARRLGPASRRAELRERLAQQHPGHHRRAREVAREVRLVGAHELRPDGPDARLDLEDPIDAGGTGSAAGRRAAAASRVCDERPTPSAACSSASRGPAAATGVVELDDLVGDVQRLVGVEQRAARRLEDQRVALLLGRSRARCRRAPRRCRR